MSRASLRRRLWKAQSSSGLGQSLDSLYAPGQSHRKKQAHNPEVCMWWICSISLSSLWKAQSISGLAQSLDLLYAPGVSHWRKQVHYPEVYMSWICSISLISLWKAHLFESVSIHNVRPIRIHIKDHGLGFCRKTCQSKIAKYGSPEFCRCLWDIPHPYVGWISDHLVYSVPYFYQLHSH